MSVGTNEEIRRLWAGFVDELGETPAAASRWIVDQGVPISAAGARGWFGLDIRDPSVPRDPEVADQATQVVAKVLGGDKARLLGQLWAVRRAIQKINRADLSEVDELFNLGVLYDAQGDTDLAEGWYRRAAKYGHTMAMNNLGVLYQERGSLDEAEDWYLLACEGGHDTAMSNLAVLYRQRGDMENAEKWLVKASDLGNDLATTNLAALYVELGEDEKAEQWLAQHGLAATG